MAEETHALVVDTYGRSFSIEEGTEEEMLKKHKSWKTKVFNSKTKTPTVKFPTPDGLPADFRRSAILGLRVVRIPEDELYRRRIAEDPRNRRFIENAKGFENHLADDGIDILDRGYNR